MFSKDHKQRNREWIETELDKFLSLYNEKKRLMISDIERTILLNPSPKVIWEKESSVFCSIIKKMNIQATE